MHTTTPQYLIFVPTAACGIDAGSGIVGTYDEHDDTVEVDFEGNRFGAVDLACWIERVAQAAGRRVDRYPTVARRRVPSNVLVEVGVFDVEGGVARLTDPDAVRAWCGEVAISSVVYTERAARRNAVRAELAARGLRGAALERAIVRYGPRMPADGR